MLPDGFEFFDGVSVWGIVVFERLDAYRADFLDKSKAVLLLIARQLNVTVVTLFTNIVFVIAQVGCLTARPVVTSFPLDGVERAATDAWQIMVALTDVVINDALSYVFPMPERFDGCFAFTPCNAIRFLFVGKLLFSLLLKYM